MKASEIKVGGKYRARVSGNFVVVLVEDIRASPTGYRAGKTTERTVYTVQNLTTGRRVMFRSAAKFRSEVLDPKPA